MQALELVTLCGKKYYPVRAEFKGQVSIIVENKNSRKFSTRKR